MRGGYEDKMYRLQVIVITRSQKVYQPWSSKLCVHLHLRRVISFNPSPPHSQIASHLQISETRDQLGVLVHKCIKVEKEIIRPLLKLLNNPRDLIHHQHFSPHFQLSLVDELTGIE